MGEPLRIGAELNRKGVNELTVNGHGHTLSGTILFSGFHRPQKIAVREGHFAFDDRSGGTRFGGLPRLNKRKQCHDED